MMSGNNSRVITKAVNLRLSNVNFLADPNYTVYIFTNPHYFRCIWGVSLCTYLYLNLNCTLKKTRANRKGVLLEHYSTKQFMVFNYGLLLQTGEEYRLWLGTYM